MLRKKIQFLSYKKKIYYVKKIDINEDNSQRGISHAEDISSESCWMKPNLDCIYTLPIDLGWIYTLPVDLDWISTLLIDLAPNGVDCGVM